MVFNSFRWPSVIRERRIEFMVTLVVLIVALASFSQFVRWVEQRPGAILADPLLAVIDPINLTWPIFTIIYGSLLAGVVFLLQFPDRLLWWLRSYIVMILVRTMTMWVIPLDPPSRMIPLSDPVVEFMGTQTLLTRDLFFSGHTATMCLLVFAIDHTVLRRVLVTLTILLGLMLLVQHVHYTVDVVAAPFFTYVSWKLASKPFGWNWRSN